MGKIIIVVCGFIFSCFHTGAQNIDSTIAIYGAQYAQERTYLHYDKSTYAPGETIPLIQEIHQDNAFTSRFELNPSYVLQIREAMRRN